LRTTKAFELTRPSPSSNLLCVFVCWELVSRSFDLMFVVLVGLFLCLGGNMIDEETIQNAKASLEKNEEWQKLVSTIHTYDQKSRELMTKIRDNKIGALAHAKLQVSWKLT
jgi:hypothetical protein